MRLEGRHAVLQLGQVTLDDLAPAPVVRHRSLHAPEGLEHRVVFLLEALETPIDLVEMTEVFRA